MEDYILIPLGSETHPGHFAKVDRRHGFRVAQYTWGLRESAGTFYAQAWIVIDGKQHRIHLHRFIMGAPDGVEVDHEDGDGLNCLDSNLRFASRKQNGRNRRKPRHTAYLYKGISQRKDNGRWTASIMVDGENHHLGQYLSAEDAARAYDYAARQHFGEFASLNFPDEDNPPPRPVGHGAKRLTKTL